MIKYRTGNLLDSNAAALVNTVNTVGVMGKGIALQFKEAYPHNFEVYRKACKAGTFSVGQVLAVDDKDTFGERLIINFPTKKHWRGKSTYDYVLTGLTALRNLIITKEIPSIAIPPLGCGNGGLDWKRVKPMIETALKDLPTIIYLYRPNPEINKQLQEYNNKEVKMTSARAMLLAALYNFEDHGEPISLFVATKLAYLLKLLGGPFQKLDFKKSFYGPYAPGMNHFVRTFNGSFLTGLEQNTARPFDPLPLNAAKRDSLNAYLREKLLAEDHQILKNLNLLISGYQSAYSLEVLATVAFIRQENPGITTEAVLAEARAWSPRKANMLRPEYVRDTMEHLKKYETL